MRHSLGILLQEEYLCRYRGTRHSVNMTRFRIILHLHIRPDHIASLKAGTYRQIIQDIASPWNTETEVGVFDDWISRELVGHRAGPDAIECQNVTGPEDEVVEGLSIAAL